MIVKPTNLTPVYFNGDGFIIKAIYMIDERVGNTDFYYNYKGKVKPDSKSHV